MHGFKITQIRGIDVCVNWTVTVVGLLITWSLAEDVLPSFAEGYSAGEYWLAGAICSAAFLLGLLAHEFGHSLVALNEGVKVSSVTLWMLGGVAQLENSPKTPRTAARIAAAGPAVSVFIGLTGLALAPLFGGLGRVSLVWFGVINLALAAFNLLPALPMDGGRLFQAFLWNQTGDEVKATERAAHLGRTIGGVLMALGLLEVLLSGTIGGLWLMAIGWFLRDAARAEWQHVQVGRPLANVTISQIMTPDPITVNAQTIVSEFVSWILDTGHHAAYPVVDDDGMVVGLIGLDTVRRLDRNLWPQVTVAKAATPLKELVIVTSSTPASEVLAKLGRLAQHRVLVVDDGTLTGIVSPSDLMRLIEIIQLLHPADSSTSAK